MVMETTAAVTAPITSNAVTITLSNAISYRSTIFICSLVIRAWDMPQILGLLAVD